MPTVHHSSHPSSSWFKQVVCCGGGCLWCGCRSFVSHSAVGTMSCWPLSRLWMTVWMNHQKLVAVFRSVFCTARVQEYQTQCLIISFHHEADMPRASLRPYSPLSSSFLHYRPRSILWQSRWPAWVRKDTLLTNKLFWKVEWTRITPPPHNGSSHREFRALFNVLLQWLYHQKCVRHAPVLLHYR